MTAVQLYYAVIHPPLLSYGILYNNIEIISAAWKSLELFLKLKIFKTR